MWLPHACGNFALLTRGPGENYLASVWSGFLTFADVSQPYNREAALKAHPMDPRSSQVVTLAVRNLVPETRDWGVYATHDDIRFRSIKRLGTDGWEVQITNPDATKVYTLVMENGKWRLK